MDVIIDQNSETAVIELARQHYRRDGEGHRPRPPHKNRTGSRQRSSSMA